MSIPSAIAQCLWAVGNIPSAVGFARALRDPEAVQERWLRRRLRADAESGFGREHDFAGIRNRRDFAKRVPLCDWDGHAGWIERIRLGDVKPMVLYSGVEEGAGGTFYGGSRDR